MSSRVSSRCGTLIGPPSSMVAMSKLLCPLVRAPSARSRLLGDAVGAGDYLQRVPRRAARLLGDGAVGEHAVAGEDLGAVVLDRLAQWLGDLAGEVVVLGPQAPRAVDARALLDRVDVGAGELHEVAALVADVLRPKVARDVPGDRLGHVAVEVGVEAFALLAVDLHEVLGRVVGVRRDEAGIVSAEVLGV